MGKKIPWKEIKKRADILRRKLPKELGIIILNHSKKAFRDQGFTRLTSPSPWKRRKTQSKADKNTKKKRAILIQSGALRRSLRVRKATFRRVAVGSYGIPYASRHNKGLKGMPRRQFIGKSKALNKRIHKKTSVRFKQIFR